MISQVWPLALTHIPVLLQLLLLLGNILPHCYQARLAAAALGPPQSTLIQQLLLLLLPAPPQPQPAGSSNAALAAAAAAAGHIEVIREASAVLAAYATTDDGVCHLVKAGVSFLPDAQKTIRWCLLGLTREREQDQQRQQQQQRLVGILQLLAVIAARPEGQRAMLKPTVAPALVDVVVEVLLLLPQQGAAAAAAPALLLLRNLAFHADLTSLAVANQQLLPLLLAAAEALLPLQQQQETGSSRPGSSDSNAAVPQWAPLYGKPVTASIAAAAGFGGGSSRPGSPAVPSAAAGGGYGSSGGVSVAGAVGNVCCAVYAVSGLWALMYQGEKIKAAVRKIPRAAATLAAVQSQASRLLQQASAAAVDSSSRGSCSRQGMMGSPRPLGDISNISAVDGPGAKRLGPGGLGLGSRDLGSQMKPKIGFSQNSLDMDVKQGACKRGRQLNVSNQGLLANIGVIVESGSVCGECDAVWWLQRLCESSGAVLDIMESV